LQWYFLVVFYDTPRFFFHKKKRPKRNFRSNFLKKFGLPGPFSTRQTGDFFSLILQIIEGQEYGFGNTVVILGGFFLGHRDLFFNYHVKIP